METHHEAEQHEPGRLEAVSFCLTSRIFIVRRWWRERGSGVKCHGRGIRRRAAPVAGEARAPLWTEISEAEFPLTAGKVQNLRAACRRLDGVEVPAGEIFSFWKQLGRTTRSKGFTDGRELRSGCLVPNLGGGLCQLSGLMHEAAVKAGLEVVERHVHSRTLPGALLPLERDATIFWNYVDLRFRSTTAWRLEARLTPTELVVTIRTAAGSAPDPEPGLAQSTGLPVRAAADGDCLTCGVTSCFRNPAATRTHAPAAGHSAWLLDGMWPEFDAWCRQHSHPGDHWITPLDGVRWRKRNYAWTPPAGAIVSHATWETLRRSWRQRDLPAQGAVRQRFLFESQRKLAQNFAKRLDPMARHLVVSQTLLPHLWQSGDLGGRTFDVLMNRWPLAELHARLDQAASRNPGSGTLSDFRAHPDVVLAESQALAAAARIVTPHRGIAALFGHRAILLEWEIPAGTPRRQPADGVKWFLPASALGRKGVYELAESLREVGGDLLVLGRAREDGFDPLQRIPCRQATVADLTECTAVVIPAWVEHEPRLALLALSSGIPVIASHGCGLAAHPLLTEVDEGDVAALLAAMRRLSALSAGYMKNTAIVEAEPAR